MTHPASDTLSAVILCAGFSSRMGRLKALLPLGRRSAIERAIDLFRGNGIADIIVVTGFQAERLSAELNHGKVREARNPDFGNGMFSSVQAGVRCLSPDSQGFFLLPVDIPLVRPYTIRLLQQVFRDHPDKIIHPGFEGRRGHPPLIPAALVPAILAWPGTQGLRGCLAASGKTVVDVDVPDRFVLADMDTPEHYQRLLAAVRQWDIPTPEECERLLQTLFPVSRDVLLHSRKVAAAAVAMGAALQKAGVALDLEMIHAAAMLHDIAKGRRGHAEVGARWLDGIGLARLAGIVAAHTDPGPLPARGVTEKELVYLADKLVCRDRLVGLDQRFGNALERFGGEEPARGNILRRYETARRIAGIVEKTAGRDLHDLLAGIAPFKEKVEGQ